MKTFITLVLAGILAGCSESMPDSYSAGESTIYLQQANNTGTYLDQYQRPWALIKTGTEKEPLKAVPAGDNRCLNEHPGMFPGFESLDDLSNYIYFDGMCHLKQTPERNWKFNRDTNWKLVIDKRTCPSGYELSAGCLKKQ